ncbi:MAG: thioredoxin fold domain-containing protein [Pseudomonadota bacterium]
MPEFLDKIVRGLCCSFLLLGAAVAPATASDEPQRGEFQGAMQTEYPDWFKTSFMELEEDILEAREAGKRLMLVFHQDGCPYCNVFVERNLAQKDIEDTIRQKFDVMEINMWGDREVTDVDGQPFTEKRFAEQLKVQFTPTVLFFDEQGQHALRINGYYPPDKFRLALEYVINKNEQQQKFSEFIAARYQQPEDKASDLSARSYIDGDATTLSRFAAEDKPLLLLFEQSDCTNCKELENKVLSLEETQALMSQYNVVRLDMWGNTELTDLSGNATTERELAKMLNVAYAPTMIFYASDGSAKQEVIRSESWFKRFHTQSLMDYVASNAWQEQPSFQRYISARAEHIQESGNNVNIFD